MGFLRILLLILTNLPEIIGLIREILGLIDIISLDDPDFDRKQAMKELVNEAKRARRTKSPKDLERMRQELIDRASRQ